MTLGTLPDEAGYGDIISRDRAYRIMPSIHADMASKLQYETIHVNIVFYICTCTNISRFVTFLCFLLTCRLALLQLYDPCLLYAKLREELLAENQASVASVFIPDQRARRFQCLVAAVLNESRVRFCTVCENAIVVISLRGRLRLKKKCKCGNLPCSCTFLSMLTVGQAQPRGYYCMDMRTAKSIIFSVHLACSHFNVRMRMCKCQLS